MPVRHFAANRQTNPRGLVSLFIMQAAKDTEDLLGISVLEADTVVAENDFPHSEAPVVIDDGFIVGLEAPPYQIGEGTQLCNGSFRSCEATYTNSSRS